MTTESSAPQILEKLIQDAEHAGASDIHIQMNNGAAQVSFRLDGVMTALSQIPPGEAERVVGRIKYLARLKTYQETLPQEGRIEKKDVSAQNDIRAATYPAVTGEKIVLRLFNQSVTLSLEELGLPEDGRGALENFLRKETGLALLTGPAGSGKTTTIYACLRFLAELGGRHVITVEDPVERIIPGIMQTEVNEARGLTFSKAVRHLMRQDPQALVIGEIRDDETAAIAVRAALTGHLVISTLHAGSCKGVVERLLTMCPDRPAAVSVMELVLNQRLVRRLCPVCHGNGCSYCLFTGYRGRTVAAEWLKLDDTLRAQIRNNGPAGLSPRMPLAESARRLVEQQITDGKEIQRVLGT